MEKDEENRVNKRDKVVGFQVVAEVRREPSGLDRDALVKVPRDLQFSFTSVRKGG